MTDKPDTTAENSELMDLYFSRFVYIGYVAVPLGWLSAVYVASSQGPLMIFLAVLGGWTWGCGFWVVLGGLWPLWAIVLLVLLYLAA